MSRLKIVLTLLLTLAALTAGAFLPQAVSGMADRAKMGETSTAPIQSLELEILSEQQRESRDMLRLLSQCGNRSNYPILAEEAAMTEDEVYKAAVEGLQKYADAGIFDGFEPTFHAAEPYLGLSKDDFSNYCRFWTVSFVKEDTSYESLFLHIDDESGKILLVNYENYEVYGGFNAATAYEYNHAVMEKFTDIYFSELGLDGLCFADIRNDIPENLVVDEMHLDKEVFCVRYTFMESDYNEFSMEFYVSSSGAFSVHFPE